MTNIKNSRFYKDVLKSEKTLKDIGIQLNKIKTTLESGDRNKAYELSLAYSVLAERLVNEARLMPLSTGYVNALDDIKDIIITETDVLVDYINNEVFYLKIPSLLTKKESGNPSYIRATTKYALDDYFDNNNKILLDEKVVIIIKHNYSKDRSYREYRDHDNIEVNAIVDLLALYILIDDSSNRCDHYYLSSEDSYDNTEVYVVPDRLLDFYLNEIKKGNL